MVITKHDNCERCALFQQCRTPWMQSTGSDDPVVLIVGEAPGEEEDERGSPFIGRSGKLLRETLEAVGFDISADIRFTNVVRCRPPGNKIAKAYINYCKHYVLEEIEHYQPELVLLMGNSPLNAVLGEHSITQWNGVVIEREDATYVPLFHPAYILRNMNAFDDWVAGMQKAVEVMTGDSKHEGYTYKYPSTFSELLEMEKHLATCDVIAYDVETWSLDPFMPGNSVVAYSLSGDSVAYAVSVLKRPQNASFVDQAITVLKRVLERPGAKIIGHNIKFDQQHTRKSLNIRFEAYGDTMLVSHMLDSRQGIHSLKRLAGLHLGMYDYDKELEDYKQAFPEANPAKGGSYGNIPPNVLLPYAAMDTEATLRLWYILYDELTKTQKDFYHDVIMGASNTLAEVEFNGNALDDVIVDRYVKIYSYIQEVLKESIVKRPSVIETVRYFQRDSDDKMAQALPEDTEHFQFDDEYLYYIRTNERQGRRKRAVIEFNPNSSYHLRHLYYNVLGIEATELTNSGLPSTAAGVMKHHVDDFKVIDDITHYKLLTKMLGTYLLPAQNGDWVSGDGRVRSNYNLHGTRTGRLSSSNPNMQNIPTPEKEADTRPNSVVVKLPVKNIFTHTYNPGVLMSVDYSGMELRVFASLAKCEPMLEIHRSGADFHSMVAIMAMTGKQPSQISIEDTKTFKKTYPEVRYRYKWTNWTLLYGGDEYTLVRLYGMEVDDAQATVKSYYTTFPEVLAYKQEAVEFAEFYGYIESPFGRREHLHYINDRDRSRRNQDRRAAVNMPVQSAASDTLLCALIIIRAKLKEMGLRTMLVNTVHDSIVLDVPYDEIDVVAELCVTVMENIVSYSGDYLPAANFDWLLSPLKADVEIGTHYGTERSYNGWIADGRPEL